ncbi:sugar phosphate isomerase/epimerase [bacterium]|nr:sugar phosphate isomerase/epimerase [bacterium]MBU1983259.1 sugar phosphate isomerase/epimerase [bacterium]
MFSPRYIYCEQSHVSTYLHEIAELGLGVEVLFENPADLWPQVRWERLLDLADAAADAGVEISAHGPFHSLNLASKDAHIRVYSQEVLLAALEAARAFRSPHLVFHTGFLPQYSPKARAKWLDGFSVGLERLLIRASELEVRLALENTYETDLTLFEDIFERFPSPALGMCLDTGHATCYGTVDPREWSHRFADRICHVHCSDNDGQSDLHLGLGTGVVDFRAILYPLARHGGEVSVTLEVSAADAAASRSYLNDLVNQLSGEIPR